MLRMLEIEENIKDIEFDAKFRRIKGNLKLLETASSGKATISVGYPDDMERILDFRKNSKDIGKLIVGYRAKLEEYSLKLEHLNTEKSTIRKQLFPSN